MEKIMTSVVFEEHEIEARVEWTLLNFLTLSYYNLSKAGTRKVVSYTR